MVCIDKRYIFKMKKIEWQFYYKTKCGQLAFRHLKWGQRSGIIFPLLYMRASHFLSTLNVVTDDTLTRDLYPMVAPSDLFRLWIMGCSRGFEDDTGVWQPTPYAAVSSYQWKGSSRWWKWSVVRRGEVDWIELYITMFSRP